MTLNHFGVMEIILHSHNLFFMNESKCPVPREQQPTNEFIELSKSKVFSWPKTKKSLILILIKFWLVSFIVFLVISSGSVYFKTSLLRYIFYLILEVRKQWSLIIQDIHLLVAAP